MSTHTPKRKSTPNPTAARTPTPTASTSPNPKSPQQQKQQPPADDPFPALHSEPLRMSYRIARGEQGVLTFEPYKSRLLPHWRFKNPEVARTSATALRIAFKRYAAARDFVGMDMARKFLQMGVTRARRYANYAGGRKYDRDTGEQLVKGQAFRGREDKLAASEIFRAELEWCRARPVYAECREEFLAEQRVWDGRRGGVEVDARAAQVAAHRREGAEVDGGGEDDGRDEKDGRSKGLRRSGRKKE